MDNLKQMQWKDNSVEKVLFVNSENGWVPYYAHPSYRPDKPIGSGLKPSKGFATAQYLLSIGYEYVFTPAPRDSIHDKQHEY